MKTLTTNVSNVSIAVLMALYEKGFCYEISNGKKANIYKEPIKSSQSLYIH